MPDLLSIDLTATTLALRRDSSIVTQVGAMYYARKYDGSMISSGTVPETVIQAALTVGGDVFISAGIYDLSGSFTTLTVGADTRVRMSRKTQIRAPNAFTGYIFTLSDCGWNCSIEGGYLSDQGANNKNFKGIKLTSATSTGIAFNVIRDVYIYKPDIGILLETTNAAGYINSCSFEDIVIHGPKNAGVDFDFTASSAIDKNRFSSVSIEMDSDSLVGFKDISGTSNCFLECNVWDSVVTAKETTISSNSLNTFIIAGSMTGYKGLYIDQGSRTTILDLALAHRNTLFTTPDILKMGMWDGSSATTATGILNGRLAEVLVGTGVSNPVEDSSGIYRTYDSGATINSLMGLYANRSQLRAENGAYFKAKIQLNNNTNMRVFCGLANSATAPASAADPLNALAGIGLWFDSAVSTDWKLYHNDSAGAGVVDALSPTVSAATGTAYIVEIWYNVPQATWRFNFNGVETAVSTDVPATTTLLSFRNYLENTTGASRVMRNYYVIVSSNK